MELALKQQIQEASLLYMNEKGLTQAELAEKSKLNGSYISSIVNGRWEVAAASQGGLPTPIADKWFIQLAAVVGVEVKKVFWKTIFTAQMKAMIVALETAKATGKTTTLICPTGMGKTFVTEKFVHEHPKHTYVITINSLMKLHDVVSALTSALGLPQKGSKAARMVYIIMKLRDIKRNGGNAVLIFDEAENMELALIKMMKGLYDGISGFASIVLMGTDQLLTKMQAMKNSNKDAGPQFYRRFKAGINVVNGTVDFKPFFNEFVPDAGLQKLLTDLCDNYGELRDFLEPAMREAYAAGAELNEHLFRVMNNMPK